MANEIEIKVPDIGGANQVDVIEVLVKKGDYIDVDTPLITLESDKASMEIPSPVAGVVSQISVKVGDKVSEGDVILWAHAEASTEESASVPATIDPEETKQDERVEPVSGQSQSMQVTIPDIGGATDVDVIDIMVTTGMHVEKDQALITLEGDKATMDIPSPWSGTVKEITIKRGDKVAQGSPVLIMDAEISASSAIKSPEPQSSATSIQPATQPTSKEISSVTLLDSTSESGRTDFISAGPAVRRLAREFGIDLNQVKGSGRKSRITTEDIQAYVKGRLSEPTSAAGAFNFSPGPVIDFTKFGEIESKPLNKIKKLTGLNVHRSWVTIPHVTQFDEADITDLESFRKSETERTQSNGVKLTVLAFVCKVVSKALQTYPQFNASLDASGEQLIYKKYCNIGIAVETPNGLVVPVIKGVDQLSVGDIAAEMARLSSKARDKGLLPTDMSGGCFTISSLGGIGGTAFTPIVNSPEVAILGLSRSSIKPVYQQGTFVPRLMLPLSLSYDHRVIDGAEAARFTQFIGEQLSDIRRVLL